MKKILGLLILLLLAIALGVFARGFRDAGVSLVYSGV